MPTFVNLFVACQTSTVPHYVSLFSPQWVHLTGGYFQLQANRTAVLVHKLITKTRDSGLREEVCGFCLVWHENHLAMLFSNMQCNTLNHSTFPDNWSLCKSALNANYIPVGLNAVEVIELLTLMYLYIILKDMAYVQLCMQAVCVTHIITLRMCSVYITTKRMPCMGMFECLCEDNFNFSFYLIISSLHVTSSIVIVSSFMSASAVENV